jgi:hypothetical protein
VLLAETASWARKAATSLDSLVVADRGRGGLADTVMA